MLVIGLPTLNPEFQPWPRQMTSSAGSISAGSVEPHGRDDVRMTSVRPCMGVNITMSAAARPSGKRVAEAMSKRYAIDASSERYRFHVVATVTAMIPPPARPPHHSQEVPTRLLMSTATVPHQARACDSQYEYDITLVPAVTWSGHARESAAIHLLVALLSRYRADRVPSGGVAMLSNPATPSPRPPSLHPCTLKNQNQESGATQPSLS